MASIDLDDYMKLIDDGNKIKSSTTEFKEEIRKIYSTIDDLKNSWTGESAKRYTDSIESYRQDFDKLVELMQGHGELVENVGSGYRDLEENM